MSFGGDIQTAREAAQKALVDVTRTVGEIASEDLEFIRASEPRKAKQIDKQSLKILGLTTSLLRNAAEGTDIAVPRLTDLESVEDNWQNIVEIIDSLLEKTDLVLDEYKGVLRNRTSSQSGEQSSQTASHRTQQYAHFGPKPQLSFHRPPPNNEQGPFKPLLRTKPHAIVSLEDSIHPASTDHSVKEYKHPYEAELKKYTYPSWVSTRSQPTSFKPLQDAAPTFVDTPEAVTAMLEELKEAKEIAIDLEHHDKHSYIGIVSLMQISTRKKDWIVDTLKPWREDLQVLNEVFADPSILKVLHGAHFDIIWLQRDLGLYIVGMFDTYHAAVTLRYPKRSLAWLLEKFAGFQAQKKYQMADWRIRPLPQELLDYARADTHFLLFIFDMMRNELLDFSEENPDTHDMIFRVQELSKQESLQKYERPNYDPEHGTGPNGWYNMLIRTPAIFSKPQFAAFRAIHQWRDQVSRKEDESTGSIMPNPSLFSIIRQMPLEVSKLWGCIPHVTEHIRKGGQEIVSLIQAAQSLGDDGPDMNEVMKNHPSTVEFENRKAARKEARAAEQALETAQIAKDPYLAHLGQDERKRLQDTAASRATVSQFWGRTITKEKGEDFPVENTVLQVDLHLQIPLPPLTAEIYATESADEVAENMPKPPPEHPYTKQTAKPNGEEIFILKERDKRPKRKAELQDAIEQSGIDPAAANEPSEAHVQDTSGSKAERKARQKAEKARKKEEEARAKQAAQEEAPFDYANAPSVLHANPRKPEKGAKQAANPYSKSMDAPRGVKRARREMPGKSHTFKS